MKWSITIDLEQALIASGIEDEDIKAILLKKIIKNLLRDINRLNHLLKHENFDLFRKNKEITTRWLDQKAEKFAKASYREFDKQAIEQFFHKIHLALRRCSPPLKVETELEKVQNLEKEQRLQQQQNDFTTDPANLALLNAIKKVRMKKGLRVYLMYAWTESEFQARESWVQASFIPTLARHFKAAGIHIIWDKGENFDGSNLEEFMANIKISDYVLILGTESLRKKLLDKDSAIHFEQKLLELKRLQDMRQEKITQHRTTIIPYVLTGTRQTAFTDDLINITIRAWRNASYHEVLVDIISQMYSVSKETLLVRAQEILAKNKVTCQNSIIENQKEKQSHSFSEGIETERQESSTSLHTTSTVSPASQLKRALHHNEESEEAKMEVAAIPQQDENDAKIKPANLGNPASSSNNMTSSAGKEEVSDFLSFIEEVKNELTHEIAELIDKNIMPSNYSEEIQQLFITLADHYQSDSAMAAEVINKPNLLTSDQLKVIHYAKYWQIHAATKANHKDILDFLLTRKKFNIHQLDNEGQTCLHIAGAQQQDDLCAFLLEKGANPNIPNQAGELPFGEVKQRENDAEPIFLDCTKCTLAINKSIFYEKRMELEQIFEKNQATSVYIYSHEQSYSNLATSGYIPLHMLVSFKSKDLSKVYAKKLEPLLQGLLGIRTAVHTPDEVLPSGGCYSLAQIQVWGKEQLDYAEQIEDLIAKYQLNSLQPGDYENTDKLILEQKLALKQLGQWCRQVTAGGREEKDTICFLLTEKSQQIIRNITYWEPVSAASSGKYKIIHFLLTQGLDPNSAVPELNTTLLETASRNRHYSVCVLLLRYGAKSTDFCDHKKTRQDFIKKLNTINKRRIYKIYNQIEKSDICILNPQKGVSQQEITDQELAFQLQEEELVELAASLAQLDKLKTAPKAISSQAFRGQHRQKLEVDVPHDGSCLFYAVVFSVLLPLLNNKDEFNSKCNQLFGELAPEVGEGIRQLLLNYDGSLDFIEQQGCGASLEALVDFTFRERLVNYMRNNQDKYDSSYSDDEPFAQRINTIAKPKAWGDETEIKAISDFLAVKICVYQYQGEQLQLMGNSSYGEELDNDISIDLVFTMAVKEAGAQKNHYHYLIDRKFIPKLPNVFTAQDFTRSENQKIEAYRQMISTRGDTLDLSARQSIDDNEVEVLSQLLKENPTITELQLGGNSIGNRGAKVLGEMLRHNTTLLTLRINNNSIGDEGIKEFSKGLSNNHHLCALYLGSNSHLGSTSARELRQALQQNSSLTLLDLRSNHLGYRGAKFLAAMLTENRSLISLSLANTGIDNKGAKALMSALEKNQTLTELNLDGLQIDSNIIDDIDDYLERNSKLRNQACQSEQAGGGRSEKLKDTHGEKLEMSTSNRLESASKVRLSQPANSSKHIKDGITHKDLKFGTPGGSMFDKTLQKTQKTSADSVSSTILTPAFIREELLIKYPADLPDELQPIIEPILESNARALAAVVKRDRYLCLKADNVGNKALHYAAFMGDRDCVRLLLEEQVGIAAANRYGLQPLHIAAFFGRTDAVAMLVNHGAEQNAVSMRVQDYKLDCSPLHLAVLNGQVEVVNYLLNQSGDKQELRVGKGGNILHLAVLSRDPWMLKKLAYHESIHDIRTADPYNEQNAKGYTPLSLAAHIGNIPAIYILSQHERVSLRTRSRREGYTVLHVAVQSLQEEAIKAVISTFGDTTALNEFLHEADASRFRRTAHQVAVDGEKEAQDPEIKIIYSSIVNRLDDSNLKALANLHKKPKYENMPIRNLVFQGGGPKGIAYVGALGALGEVLSQRGSDLKAIRRVAGTSAGAITAILVALDFDVDEMAEELSKLELASLLGDVDAQQLKDLIEEVCAAAKGGTGSSIANTLLSVIREAYGLNNNLSAGIYLTFHRKKVWEDFKALTSICSGDAFVSWLREVIARKLEKDGLATQYNAELTFGQLAKIIALNRGNASYKHLHIVTCCISEGPKLVEMSSEDDAWQNIRLIDAVRASMSIPGVFKPQVIAGKAYVDGGILMNYPIKIFDKVGYLSRFMRGDKDYEIFNEETLGFRLVNKAEEAAQLLAETVAIKDLKTFLLQLFNAFYNAEKVIAEFENKYQYRSIKIDTCGVGTLDFDLSDEKKQELQVSGENAIREFFQEYDLLVDKKKAQPLAVVNEEQEKYSTEVQREGNDNKGKEKVEEAETVEKAKKEKGKEKESLSVLERARKTRELHQTLQRTGSPSAQAESSSSAQGVAARSSTNLLSLQGLCISEIEKNEIRNFHP